MCIRDSLKREERRQKKSTYRFQGDLSIDYSAKTVQISGQDIEFTKLEYSIIEFLSMNPGIVYDKERIYEKVCGYDGDGDSRVITELIRRIRKKDVYKRQIWGWKPSVGCACWERLPLRPLVLSNITE